MPQNANGRHCGPFYLTVHVAPEGTSDAGSEGCKPHTVVYSPGMFAVPHDWLGVHCSSRVNSPIGRRTVMLPCSVGSVSDSIIM